MSSFNVINLAEQGPVDLGEHLEGGWGTARLIDLDAGGTRVFEADDTEVCAFVIDGNGTVTMGSNVARLEAGVGVTLMKGSTATVAADQPMRLFATWLLA